jgi:hypothetical protein
MIPVVHAPHLPPIARSRCHAADWLEWAGVRLCCVGIGVTRLARRVRG